MESQDSDPKAMREAALAYQVKKRSAVETSIVHSPFDAQTAIRLLDALRTDGDAQEQRETWEFLKQALDDDRLSARKLFP